ncbi:MAG: NAD(P)H-hydrate dehydratase [Clostridia bacterium]|nr:NAD(P)H-hydrate dehydratase [Clostridia bacterium]
MFIVTSKQMYAAELSAVKRGGSFHELMEKAGNACAKIIYDTYCADKKKKVLIICGKGKNGGDGFVIARSLWEKGCEVSVLLACGEPRDSDSKENFNLLESAGIQVRRYNGSAVAVSDLLKSNDIFVDAVFGTGFKGKLDDDLSLLAKSINAFGKTLISIDVPSGADCDNATAEGEVFLPDMTIAISALKPVHIMKPANQLCGEIKNADIGIKSADYESITPPAYYTCEEKDIKELLPKRKPVSNKGTYGHALCICGSLRMPGAAFMSVQGAIRTGAGLVTAAFPKGAYPAMVSKLSECLFLPAEETFDGTFSFTALPAIIEAAKKCTAVLIGCGIGFNRETERLTESFLKEISVPVVIDADALNILSKNPDLIRDIIAPVILTPHPGEFSRLTGKTIKEILLNPVETAKEFSDKYRCTVVLKTANTVICSPDKPTYINTTGNAGLAKGGSGDLLAGMIVSLLAQGMSPEDASAAAVYMHGNAADILAEKTSMRGMTATDLLSYLPEYYGRFEK